MLENEAFKKALGILRNNSPKEWKQIAGGLTKRELDDLAKELEHLSKISGMLAVYFEERHGYGIEDQGHKTAVKRANKAGKKIWCNAFGYNAYHDLLI
jgi:hypothetical protein